MKRITQHKIAEHLEVRQSFISMVMTGKRKISWPMAEKLSELFPAKGIKEWKRSTPDEIVRAFRSLESR